MTTLYDGRPLRYAQLPVLIAVFKPALIIEVGTNRGDSAEAMCLEALRHKAKVRYIGFDVFDTKDAKFHEAALNRKGFETRDAVAARLNKIQSEHPGFSYRLEVGETRETLHGRKLKADFVFIDGDHRAEVITRDYAALQSSQVVVFDDYYPASTSQMVDGARFGCRTLVDGLPGSMLLPIADVFDNVGEIRFAMKIRRKNIFSLLNRSAI